MASHNTTDDVHVSRSGEVPQNYNSDDYNMSNDNYPTFKQELHDEEHDQLVDEGPQVGMMYESRKHLKKAYKKFGLSKGFGVSIRTSRPNYVIIACDRGRKNNEAKRSTKRVNCQARISASTEENGYWRVNAVESAHNHELNPDMSRFMACRREFTFGLEETDMFQAHEAGNSIDERRRLRLGDGDAAAMQNFFSRMQLKDPDFFHMMDIDDDGWLRNVMWIDGRSRAAYEDFHDVVRFDTTYLVKGYQMPLATVVGINHHDQSILLGCALLSHEQSESFKWFFATWLEAMGGVQPTAILTDHCDKIENALKEVMPTTIHRFCIGHIFSKNKFKGVKDYRKVVDAFKNLVYDCLSVAEFEWRWGKFLVEFRMSTDKWLKDLYDVRDCWVPIYLTDTFWAGMLPTQKSESMHAFFDSYINASSTLKSFVEQYEIAITNITYKETEADHRSKCTYLTRRTRYAWEDLFGRVYTNNVFVLLQKEIDKLLYCNMTQLDETKQDALNGIVRYEIKDSGIINNWYHKEYVYSVEYRMNGGYLHCHCRKFEREGIFCCHILKFIMFNGIGSVNERYVMRRWRKDVYRPHSHILLSEGGNPRMTSEHQLCREKFEKCIQIAFKKPGGMKLLKRRLDELIKELSEL